MIGLLLVLVAIVALVGGMIWALMRLDTISDNDTENPLDDTPSDVLG